MNKQEFLEKFEEWFITLSGREKKMLEANLKAIEFSIEMGKLMFKYYDTYGFPPEEFQRIYNKIFPNGFQPIL